jgi:hypothetical protein
MAMGTDLPVIETAMQGWRDAMAARERMPMLFWIGGGVVIALGILHVIVGGITDGLILSLIFAIAQAAALTPVAIGVHRFVLLREARDGYDFAFGDARFQKFLMYIVALEVLRELPYIIAFPFAFVAGFLHSLVLLILAIVAAVISVRCMILFAAIAVDAPGADWRNAVADSKGHSWRIFLVLLCTVLPAIIVAAIVMAILVFSVLTAAFALAVIIPAIVVALTAALAAVVSRLFAAYSSQLGRPGNLYLRAAV